MNYYFGKSETDTSHLVLGDKSGSVIIISFSPVNRGPFQNTPERGNIVTHLRYEEIIKVIDYSHSRTRVSLCLHFWYIVLECRETILLAWSLPSLKMFMKIGWHKSAITGVSSASSRRVDAANAPYWWETWLASDSSTSLTFPSECLATNIAKVRRDKSLLSLTYFSMRNFFLFQRVECWWLVALTASFAHGTHLPRKKSFTFCKGTMPR